MDLQTHGKIIYPYLKGISFGEMTGSLEMARSTVQHAVERWRNGYSGLLGEHLQDVDQILEIAKHM